MAQLPNTRPGSPKAPSSSPAWSGGIPSFDLPPIPGAGPSKIEGEVDLALDADVELDLPKAKNRRRHIIIAGAVIGALALAGGVVLTVGGAEAPSELRSETNDTPALTAPAGKERAKARPKKKRPTTPEAKPATKKGWGWF